MIGRPQTVLVRDRYGGGHFATAQAHVDRWRLFAEWCREQEDIRDARKLDAAVLDRYAQTLCEAMRCGELAIATAQNRLSSINQTLLALRGNRQLRIDSPRRGASAPRWVPATDAVRAALAQARAVSPRGSRNLLAPGKSFSSFLNRHARPARAILHAQGLKGFHEFRAANACDRYSELTAHLAPPARRDPRALGTIEPVDVARKAPAPVSEAACRRLIGAESLSLLAHGGIDRAAGASQARLECASARVMAAAIAIGRGA